MFVIFVIIVSGQEDRFLTFRNELFPNTISFTIEKEVGGKLTFLDSLVIWGSDCYKTTVYRKPTHSDRYLHFSSHHPQAVMRAVVHGMTRRAVALCEPEFLGQELKHAYNTFKDNGYPPSLVDSVIRRTLKKERKNKEKRKRKKKEKRRKKSNKKPP
ncbi:hypothetical protein M513_11935 [Trichuris suis]|uniref:Helix-turn-helix domain-containing protein n=1 Tax=Trichuris suis TaxID=68888 RepID=A0A085LQI2_9BILA|nr:hypothetical protein M513_11935 [Trichuris suis]